MDNKILFVSLDEFISVVEKTANNMEELHNKIKIHFSDFTTCKNESIQSYIREGKMLTWERKDMARTYLFLDKETFKLVAFFTLSFGNLLFIDDVKKSKRQKIHGESGTAESAPMYLIGKLGRDDNYKDIIKIDSIFEKCYELIALSYKLIGGRFVLIECKEERLRKYYEENGFDFLQKTKDKYQLIKPIEK